MSFCRWGPNSDLYVYESDDDRIEVQMTDGDHHVFDSADAAANFVASIRYTGAAKCPKGLEASLRTFGAVSALTREALTSDGR